MGLLDYIKNLEFKDKPDYKGILTIFKNLAARQNIDLNDGVYDWALRAVLLRDYPEKYDDFEDPE